MMTLQWHSDPGESLPGKDVAERIAFLPRSGVTATAVCSVAHKFADAGTGPYCTAVSDVQAQTGGPVRRGKWPPLDPDRLSSKGPSPASRCHSRVGPLPERTTSIWGRNWLSPGRAAYLIPPPNG